MIRRRITTILAVLGLAGLLLGGLWLALPDPGQAAPAPVDPVKNWLPAGEHSLPDSEPAPEWLKLVRSAHEGNLGQAAGPVTMHLDMAAGYVAGRVPTGSPVEVEIWQEGGLVADITALPVLENGSFFYYGRPLRGGFGDTCLGSCYPYIMQPGDEVRVLQTGAGLTMTVPTLTALAKSEADLVSGEGPSSASLGVFLFPEAPAGTVFTQTVVTDLEGAYLADWSSILDIWPRDDGYTVYTQDEDRAAYVRFFAPFLRMQIGADRISGLAAPNQYVAITITNQAGVVIDARHDYTSEDGRFGPVTWIGLPLQFEPGYGIRATAGGQLFTATVGAVSAESDLANGRVTGRAAPGTQVAVLRHPGPLLDSSDELLFQPPGEEITAVADMAGDYQAALSLAPGNFGAALWTDARGHQTYARYAVPQHHILLGDSLGIPGDALLWGQVDAPGKTFTVAVRGPSGFLKHLILQEAYDNGAYSYFDFGLPSRLRLETGDVVTLTTRSRVELSAQLPELTAEADPQAGTVSGLAPPNTLVTVRLSSDIPWKPYPGGHAGSGGGGEYDFELSLVVTATAQGGYLADFNALGGFDALAFGQVEVPLGDGHTIARRFRALDACPPVPLRVEVGHVEMDLFGTPDCLVGHLRLRDAQGKLKVEQLFSAEYTYFKIYLQDGLSGKPVIILPGNRIEIEAQGMTTTVDVPSLTVEADTVQNQVNGQAPAGQSLEVQIWQQGPPFGFHVFTTTVSAQGEFALSLDGLLTLRAGDQVEVSTRIGPTVFARKTVLPILQARLDDRSLQGYLLPFTPFTLTQLVPGTPSVTTTGETEHTGHFYVHSAFDHPGDILRLVTPNRILSITVPALTMDFDSLEGVLLGLAPPESRLVFELQNQPELWLLLETTADTAGNFVFDHPWLALLEYPEGELIHFDDNGNQTWLRFSQFRWLIELGFYCIAGRGAPPDVPISLTLESPDGLYQEEIMTWAYHYDGHFSGCFQRTVQPGSRLVYEDGVRSREFIVPLLTARLNTADQVLVGTAPPYGWVEVGLTLENYQEAYRQVRADGDGQFGLDLSDLALNWMSYGILRYEDRENNVVSLIFPQASLAYLPWVPMNP